MTPPAKTFDTFFRAISYAVVFCGAVALYLTGGLGVASAGLFGSVMVAAWFLEDTRWRISERAGTALLFVMVPLFYFGWRYKLAGLGGSDTALAGSLARMILILAAIKLLQKKSDRDWLFLYLMSFFEILLAAGMSVSALYFAALILYSLVSICAIITFEIRKTSRTISQQALAGRNIGKLFEDRADRGSDLYKRLPLTAFALLIFVVAVAAPLFYVLPRVGGAGFGNNSSGLSGFTGFSDSVRLGAIGTLKQSNEIVMRVVLKGSTAEPAEALRWRGVMLDTFDNRSWQRATADYREPYVKGRGNFFQFDKPALSAAHIAMQTIYLEPIDSQVLFALARPFAAEQTSFQTVYKDSDGGIGSERSPFERVTYTVYSDRRTPGEEDLRADTAGYPQAIRDRYLQLPGRYDPRIAELAAEVTKNAGPRYEKARAIENYLHENFGYTLEMKAAGDEPLADFLLNVRQGHCEYFATAMAVMLRTQGVATRVVNGFQQGEYNETAGVYVVRQRDAHSWVEVYFPKEDVWVPFDPTPAAGQFNENPSGGIFKKFNQYIEALETFWIQYFVSYDNQGQRSLFRTVRSGFVEFQADASAWIKIAEVQISDWWREVRGDRGLQARIVAVGYGIGFIVAGILGILLIIWLYRKIKRIEFWRKLRDWLKRRNEATIIEFYERMQKVLAGKGFTRQPHQTPLEFAFDLKMPEAVSITEKYNRVRFGEKGLSSDEAEEIEVWLKELETTKSHEGNEKNK